MKLEEFTKKVGKKTGRKDKVSSVNLTYEQHLFIKRYGLELSKLVRALLDEFIKKNEEMKK
jgi:hypothetical protein